ncbi:MAG: dockerin type I domain-containing protein [Ruminococcus sp.]|nr:dockerin type I domain-containing protein [Ruminococcus sp.]
MKKLLSLMLTLIIIAGISITPAFGVSYHEQLFLDAVAKLEDDECAYYTVMISDINEKVIYNYPSWVKANDLLLDTRAYTAELDAQLFNDYYRYVKAGFEDIKAQNIAFFNEHFTHPDDKLIFASEQRGYMLVYVTKSELLKVRDMQGVGASYHGQDLEQVMWRAEDTWFDIDSYTPKPYELVYGLHYYENNELQDLRWDDGGGTYMYYKLYSYYESSEDEAKPDYVLIFAGDNICSPAYSAGQFGDYLLQCYNIYYPYIFGYHIITTDDMRVLTLTEAYEENIPNIMAVFEEYGLGQLRGDVNDDGKINVRDATRIQKALAELEPLNDYVSGFGEEEDFEARISDFNKDLRTNIRDVTDIQKHIAGIAINDPDFEDFENNPIPEPTTTAPRTDAQITLGGKTYEAQVGDTITLTAELYCSTVFNRISATVRYDTDIITVAPLDKDTKEEWFKAHLPNLPRNNLKYYGYNNDSYDMGKIMLYPYDQDGIDFKEKKLLFTFDFMVVGGGDMNLDVTLDSIHNQYGLPLYENNQSVGGTNIEFSYSLKVN